MAVPFMDTSALVKRYVLETGSHWVIGLTDLPVAGKDCWISSITPVELLAALYLRVRTGSLTLPMAQQAEQKFRQELGTHFNVISLIPVILNRAMGLVAIHPLRAYDAVQLAAALYLHSQNTPLGLPSIIMVSADHNLNQAAIAEGLAIDDPNQHP
jgi:predicted nucleic acid-binding protein